METLTTTVTETQHQPLVSIIIPTKDRCTLLLETLASVQSQTYRRWEAVVVDDLSHDDTWPVLESLAANDPRIRSLRRAGPLGGAAVARNQGFAASRGSFIIFLDSDDLLTPTALDVRLRLAAAHPDADAIVFRSEHFRDFPGQYTKECAYSIRLFDGVDPLDAFLASNSIWWTAGPLWRRESIELVGPWDNQFPPLDDNEYHTRALIVGTRFRVFAEVDLYVRLHQYPQISRSNNANNISQRLVLVDHVIAQLRARDMLTRRRKRMVAWSTFLQTLGYALERPRPTIRKTLSLWRASRDRALVDAPAYLAGSLLALLQWLRFIGPLPRELARLILYVDLQGKKLFHPALFRTIYYFSTSVYKRYRSRGWFESAKGRRSQINGAYAPAGAKEALCSSDNRF